MLVPGIRFLNEDHACFVAGYPVNSSYMDESTLRDDTDEEAVDANLEADVFCPEIFAEEHPSPQRSDATNTMNEDTDLNQQQAVTPINFRTASPFESLGAIEEERAMISSIHSASPTESNISEPNRDNHESSFEIFDQQNDLYTPSDETEVMDTAESTLRPCKDEDRIAESDVSKFDIDSMNQSDTIQDINPSLSNTLQQDQQGPSTSSTSNTQPKRRGRKRRSSNFAPSRKDIARESERNRQKKIAEQIRNQNIDTSLLIHPETSMNGRRRSTRLRVKPLEFWKNEKAVYETSSKGTRTLIGVAKAPTPKEDKPAKLAALRKANNKRR